MKQMEYVCTKCGFRNDINYFDVNAADDQDPDPVISCPRCHTSEYIAEITTHADDKRKSWLIVSAIAMILLALHFWNVIAQSQEPAVDNQIRAGEMFTQPECSQKDEHDSSLIYKQRPFWKIAFPGYEKATRDSTQNIMTFENFLDLWQQYKAECWKDSTPEKIHTPIEIAEALGCFGTIDWGSGKRTCKNPDHYKFVMIHKDATAEGFLDWLTERIK